MTDDDDDISIVIFDSFGSGEPVEQTLDQVSDALLEHLAPTMPEAQAELDRRRGGSTSSST